MHSYTFLWSVFILFVATLISVDLYCSANRRQSTGIQFDLKISIFYVVASLLFAGFIAKTLGQKSAIEFISAYGLEKALSIDNVVVISSVFSFFKIPERNQHRTLLYGIAGVFILRGALIGLGLAFIHQFQWLVHVLGVFLLIIGYMMLRKKDDEADDRIQMYLKSYGEKHFKLCNDPTLPTFFVYKMHNGMNRWHITPLFLALVSIECVDFIFALDSVPAVFMITQNSYIVFTSNICAILGLRALYNLLSSLTKRLKYLNIALGILLMAMGIKSLVRLFL